MRIGLDVDGVIAGFTDAWRKLGRELLGKDTEGIVQSTWGFDSLGFTQEEEKEMWKYIDTTPEWWEHEPIRLPHTSLLEFADKQHELFFITNRKLAAGNSIEKQTKLWLQDRCDLFCPTVLVTKNKGELAKVLNLQYFIDDKPANCEDVYSNSHKTSVYIHDATYNQGEVPHLERAASLNDFFRRIGAVKE